MGQTCSEITLGERFCNPRKSSSPSDEKCYGAYIWHNVSMFSKSNHKFCSYPGLIKEQIRKLET